MRALRLLHLIARRGNSLEFPENTVPALRSAIALGARFMEVDVHVSADGVPVVAYDRELARVSNHFLTLSAAQLERLDMSQSNRFGQRHRGASAATLASTLQVLDGRPEITVFVMLGRAAIAHFGHEQVVSQVVRALKPFRSRCILASSDLPAVHAARSIAGYPIAWALPAYDDHTRLKYEALNPEYLFCNRAHLPTQGTLWRGPWKWVLHEADTLEDVLNLAERGADFVVTRHVRTLSDAMRTYAATHAPTRAESATPKASARTEAATPKTPLRAEVPAPAAVRATRS